MKRKVSAIATAAAVLVAACVIADAGRQFYVTVLSPAASASVTGTATDIAAYKGNGLFVVQHGTSPATAYTSTVTLTHCATSGGSYTTVTNIGGSAVAVTKNGSFTNAAPSTVQIDSGRLHRYVKATVAQSNYTNNISAILVFPQKAE